MSIKTQTHLSIWSPRPQGLLCERLSPEVCLHRLPALNINIIHLEKTSLLDLRRTDAWLFISQAAVNALFKQLPNNMPKPRLVIAIGSATQKRLAAYGWLADFTAPAPFSSEALLADKNFRALPFNSLGIICGVGGRKEIQKVVRAQGKEVTRIECYSRDKCNLSPEIMVKFLNAHQINGIIMSSCGVADAVMDNLKVSLFDKAYLDWPIFVLSARIREHAAGLGFRQILVAEQSSQQSLNKRILTWWESR